ncbi:MAG TPA: hypothetical protein VF183_07175 [Acidimicrobiales bacterium]
MHARLVREVIAAGALVVALSVLWLHDPRFEGDSRALVRGARHAAGCIDDGIWTECGEEVVHFPLVQYLLTIPGLAADWSDERILRSFEVVNVAAMLGAGVVLVRTGRRLAARPGAWLMAAVALSSPLLAYGKSTFREPLTASILVLFAAAAVARVPRPLVATLAFAATINHETLAPFVLGVGLLAARGPDGGRLLPPWRATAAITAGIAAGVISNALFNVFRFGTIRNVPLLADEYRVPTNALRAELAAALWVSPNGGLLWFWMIPVVLLVVVASRGVAIAVRNPRDVAAWAPRVAPLGLAIAHSAGLASWWSPWGWYAWGPRLSLPLVAALALLALQADRLWLGRVIGSLLARPVLLVVTVAVSVVLALPHLGVAHDEEPYRGAFFTTVTEDCPDPVGTHIDGTQSEVYYYECQLLRRAWKHRPLVLLDRAGGALSVITFPVLVLSAALLLMVGWTPDLEKAGAYEPQSVTANPA